jgi:hypothetical protein
MSTVTATRIVRADPASTALLLAGPSALDFWPGLSRESGLLSPVSARAALAGDQHRRLVIRSQPPRRTPTAYVTAFAVEADGLPTASGTLRVTRQGWVSDGEADGVAVPTPTPAEYATDRSLDTIADVAAIRLELRTEVDYDEAVEQEIAAAAATFLDNLAAFASGNSTPAPMTVR